jgi:hypothetical protein
VSEASQTQNDIVRAFISGEIGESRVLPMAPPAKSNQTK